MRAIGASVPLHQPPRNEAVSSMDPLQSADYVTFIRFLSVLIISPYIYGLVSRYTAASINDTIKWLYYD